MAPIKAGTYRPLYLSPNSPKVQVAAFQLDRLPVTNAAFAAFVAKQTQWQKGRARSVFVEAQYLQHWPKSHQAKPADAHKPVVNVSWFAADAYCRAQGKHLPTVAQWEYVAMASAQRANGSQEAGYKQTILAWYGKPAQQSLAKVGQGTANFWGVHDLHGLIWEWTDDFNSSLVSGESRADSSFNQQMFCGAGAVGAVDPGDYAAFMRHGFRSSLQAKFTLNSLGFRCAK
ncbi:MAG: formylglycine-generating enzyme family protein [Neisseriaceae bacterium]|nr:formylglycine-generating enzyme family protein [Neisseriaceae bacterium]